LQAYASEFCRPSELSSWLWKDTANYCIIAGTAAATTPPLCKSGFSFVHNSGFSSFSFFKAEKKDEGARRER
jgi:hypothetical protein